MATMTAEVTTTATIAEMVAIVKMLRTAISYNIIVVIDDHGSTATSVGMNSSTGKHAMVHRNHVSPEIISGKSWRNGTAVKPPVVFEINILTNAHIIIAIDVGKKVIRACRACGNPGWSSHNRSWRDRNRSSDINTNTNTYLCFCRGNHCDGSNCHCIYDLFHFFDLLKCYLIFLTAFVNYIWKIVPKQLFDFRKWANLAKVSVNPNPLTKFNAFLLLMLFLALPLRQISSKILVA